MREGVGQLEELEVGDRRASGDEIRNMMKGGGVGGL